jgi:hypothetical protein
MTKHYELIDSIPGKIQYIPAENFWGFALHPCQQMCVNIADPTKPSG